MSFTNESVAALETAIRARDAYQEGQEIRFLAPCHDDHHPSARWNPDKHTWFCDVCHQGGGWKDLARRLQVQVIASGNGASLRIVATYSYRDPAGTLLYEVLRLEPKAFRQRRPDGNGGWIWNLQGEGRVLYRLPIVVTDFSQPICFHEGEKACNAAVAAALPGIHTTTSGGASNSHLTDISPCGGRDVLIVPDDDAPGRRYAETLASRLVEIGATSVRIVSLPNLPQHGDVVEWLTAGGTPEQFAMLCQAAPLYSSTTSASPPEHNQTAPGPQDDRHELDADVGDLMDITRQALHVLVSRNDPPRLLLHGGLPVRLEADADGRLKPVELTVDRVRHELAIAAKWTKEKKAPFGGIIGREDARPPVDVAKNILATPELPFPILKAINEVPVVTRDGRIIQQPGYDHGSGIYYYPFNTTIHIAVPGQPTHDDVTEAKALLDEVIGDFAFVGDSDRAHAVALAIGMFCRDLIDGPTPLHDFEAPSPGTGKNLLVECLLYPAVGRNVGLVAEAKDDEELRKRITARLREGRPVLVIDNLSRPLDSGVLSAALTARQWDDRLLGKTETVSLSVRTMWALTANNPVFSMEIARRCVRIRLDTRTDRPWLRDQFRHDNLRQWVEEHRADLIRAILILIRAWLNAGRPAATAKSLGSFESWSQVIGGIVTFAGYSGFLGNVIELYETADSEGRAWRIFIEQWWQTYQDRPVSVSNLVVIAETVDGLYLGKTTNERGQRTSLGRQLKKRRDQIITTYRIEEAGVQGGSTQWRLRPTGDAQSVEQTTVPAEEVNLR